VILKFKKNYSKFCLITILFICVFHSQSVFASREPRIRVLISKNNNLRIRSDRSIPLIIEGEFFSSKKIIFFQFRVYPILSYNHPIFFYAKPINL